MSDEMKRNESAWNRPQQTWQQIEIHFNIPSFSPSICAFDNFILIIHQSINTKKHLLECGFGTCVCACVRSFSLFRNGKYEKC